MSANPVWDYANLTRDQRALMNLAHHIKQRCTEHGTCGECVDSAMDCGLPPCEDMIIDWAYRQADAGFPTITITVPGEVQP
jgi:hypothetical protein